MLYYGQPDSVQRIKYGQDVAPIVVTQDSPASPILVFEMDGDPAAGNWDFTVTATLVDGRHLVERSCMALSPETITFLAAPGDSRPTRPLFKDFVATIDGVKVTTAGLEASCYRG